MKLSKKTIKIIIIFGFSLILLILLFLEQATADTNQEPALIFIKINKEKFFDPNFLILDIAIDNPSTSTYNAIGISAEFNPEQIQLSEITYENSFCDLIAVETVNNASGTLNIVCGSAVPNSTATATALHLKFNKLTAGFSTIDLSGSELITADGTGQPIYSLAETNNIYLYKP